MLTANNMFIGAANKIFQIWEHNDGSGMPNRFFGANISKESNIISLANTYHNCVYRITPEDLHSLRQRGYAVQEGEMSFRRHNEAIKTLYRRANWFDYDIFQTFIDIIKKHTCSELKTSSS